MTTLPDTSLKAWRPPMGWSSWDSYGTTITEDEVLANARFMAEHLKAAGWDTLVIDAGSIPTPTPTDIPTVRHYASMNTAGSCPTNVVFQAPPKAKGSARSPMRCMSLV